MIQTIARQYGVHYTDEQVAALSFEEKSNWLKRNPVTAATHFHYRLNVFFQDFLKSTAKPLGEIADYAIRIEFQARSMCLAEFATTYVVKYERNDCDALPTPESDVTSTQITLTDGFGKIHTTQSELCHCESYVQFQL